MVAHLFLHQEQQVYDVRRPSRAGVTGLVRHIQVVAVEENSPNRILYGEVVALRAAIPAEERISETIVA